MKEREKGLRKSGGGGVREREDCDGKVRGFLGKRGWLRENKGGGELKDRG